MTEKSANRIEDVVARVIELESELEASSDTMAGDAQLVRAKEILHAWVDSVTAVIATPGVGRAVLMHENGTESRISSPDLPFRLAVPVTFAKSEG